MVVGFIPFFQSSEDADGIQCVRFIDLHRLEASLQFTPVFGPGHECAHVEGINLLALQVFGNIAVYDPVSQSFSNGSLAHPGFSDEDRVVFRPAAQYLQYPADLFIPSDYGIQFPFPCHLIEIPGIPVQGVVILFGRLALDIASLTKLFDRGKQVFFGDAIVFHQPRCGIADREDPK